MKLLLDTHIWLWALLTPDRLPEGIKTLLAAPGHDVCMSAISLWETLHINSKGHIAIVGDAVEWIGRQVRASQVDVMPLTPEIIFSAYRLPFNHKDPADRWIVATALGAGATLLTVDRALIAAKLVPVVAR